MNEAEAWYHFYDQEGDIVTLVYGDECPAYLDTEQNI